MNNSVQIIYTHVAEKDLRKLPKEKAVRILKKIKENASDKDVLAQAKPLTGQFAGCYRYRVGSYRVIFTVESSKESATMIILSVKHRKDVYR